MGDDYNSNYRAGLVLSLRQRRGAGPTLALSLHASCDAAFLPADAPRFPLRASKCVWWHLLRSLSLPLLSLRCVIKARLSSYTMCCSKQCVSRGLNDKARKGDQLSFEQRESGEKLHLIKDFDFCPYATCCSAVTSTAEAASSPAVTSIF